MPLLFNEKSYSEVQEWLSNNPHDARLSPAIYETLSRFEQLTEPQKAQLQAELLVVPELPDVFEHFMPRINPLDKFPTELWGLIAQSLDDKDKGNLGRVSSGMYCIFTPPRVKDHFLTYVAYGQQDKAEELLGQIFQGQPEKIQAVLLHQGTVTDYSGRTFKCSAYEYAYWAKDTYMCRMLEGYMDDATKAQMLDRIVHIEANGLTFQQNDAEHCSAHFDFRPLINAYQDYLEHFDAWLNAGNWDAMCDAWLAVATAQRDVPAHVAQEYCRPDRNFSPTPTFSEAGLPRSFIFYNHHKMQNDSWFPLSTDGSGLGVDFGIARTTQDHANSLGGRGSKVILDRDAIIRLDAVRTADLAVLRERLHPLVVLPQMNG